MLLIHCRRSSYTGFTPTRRDFVPLQLLAWDDVGLCIGYADGPFVAVSFGVLTQ